MKTLYIIIQFLLFTTFIHSQTEWFKYHGNPVLVPGPAQWDNIEVSFGKVLFDGTEYKMWYMGIGNIYQIGLATSVDGIHWEKYSGNPVLTPGDAGSWDAGGVGTPTVVFSGSIYQMWYAGSPTNPPTQIRIGYATSPDGITWTKHQDPVLDLGSAGEWDDYWVTHPTVLEVGSGLSYFVMWYTGTRTNVNGKIGYAENLSSDGINWTKHNDSTTISPPYAESDPVLQGSPGTWDASTVWQANVIFNFPQSFYGLFYAGNNGGTQKIGYATSSDGIEWDKHPTPVLSETFSILAPGVSYDYLVGNSYRMWYTSIDRRIYYAVTDSSLFPTSVDDFSNTPETFSLSQNYPNPFNPSTVIGYQLSVSGDVSLKIYDLLGREVATLVDEYKPSGSYEVEFLGNGLSSGIYFYRLAGEKYSATKKMVVLK